MSDARAGTGSAMEHSAQPGLFLGAAVIQFLVAVGNSAPAS